MLFFIGRGLGTNSESSHFTQPFAKGAYNRIIALLYDVWCTEQVALRMFRVGRFSPQFITPKTVHPVNTVLWNGAGVAPNCVPVHIHYRKIQEHIDGTGLTCHFHRAPLQVKAVRIEQAECTLVILVLDRRQKRLDKIFRGVARFDMNVTSAGTKRFKMRGFLRVHIYKNETVERW